MKRLVLCMCFLLPVAFLGASEYQIHNLTFLPAEYYVGDTVTMSFLLKINGAETVAVPEDLPSAEWMRYLSVDVEKAGKDFQISIRLIPYYPGTRSLPPLALGSLVLRDLKIYTSSLLTSGGDRELAGIRGPLLIPGTKAVGTLLVLLLFTLPVLLFFMGRILYSRAGDIIQSYKINLPYRRFRRILHRIRAVMATMPEKEFYNSFSSAFRVYLSNRFHKDFSSATTREIKLLMAQYEVKESLILSLAGLFHQVDRVKFAGDTMMFSDRQHLLEDVEQVLEGLEEWRKNHADI